jgi:glycosyltransferase EpsE
MTKYIHKPKISIIMGIYNCSVTLQFAVECLINQTFQDWELIMCDDYSSDDTFDKAVSLCEKDSRIIVIRNEKNMGLAYSLNHCLENVRGKYIARMDGDDLCSPVRFEIEINYLDKHPKIHFVSTNMTFFDEKGEFGKFIYPENPNYIDFVKGSPFCHAGCMIKTDALKLVEGYRVSDDTQRVEDYDLWIRLYEAGYKGYNIQEYLYNMRDDRYAFERRKFRYRLNEWKLSKKVCKVFKLPAIYRIYSFRPLIVGLLPEFSYKILHHKRLANYLSIK